MKGMHAPVCIISVDASLSFFKCYEFISSNTLWFPQFLTSPPPSSV